MIIILGVQHVGIIHIHDALAFQPSNNYRLWVIGNTLDFYVFQKCDNYIIIPG